MKADGLYLAVVWSLSVGVGVVSLIQTGEWALFHLSVWGGTLFAMLSHMALFG